MYNAFFGFKEKPFKLVPNPAFLFLGKSHEEALAHLTYATIQGDGFVQITGEIGTGKTTLCRTFLENLDPSVDAAFIFNTNLDALGLLRAVNKELSIDATAETTTELIETLNQFLVENSRQGKSVLLLIDEAQNLNIETLEQLRMLSNLETTKNKLIQIILVGQPELETLLGSHALRQLAQRINLSCCLLPMTPNETRAYINHRINVASRRKADLFTPGAQRSIYHYSGGIPRLVNIACDRALVVAYSLNRTSITRSTAKLAIHELSARRQEPRPSPRASVKFILPGILILAIGLISLTLLIGPMDRSTFFSDHPDGFNDKAMVASVATPKDKTIQQYLKENGPIATRETLLGQVFSRWRQDTAPITAMIRQIQDENDFFKIAAMDQGLEMIRLEKDLHLIKTLNLPAILPFTLPGQARTGYLLLSAITENGQWIITAGNGTDTYRVMPNELSSSLTGTAYLPYRESPGLSGVISKRSPGAQIINLKLLLKAIGFQGINLTPDYDDKVRQAIVKVQSENSIKQDGLAGPVTRVLLYNRLNPLSTPHLRSQSKP